jgi:hypothetical protein
MASLFFCKQCQTPLLSSFDLNDPRMAAADLEMSHLALGGDGFACNVYLEGRGCPICGQQSDVARGISPSRPREIMACTRKLDQKQRESLLSHAMVHLRQDAQLKPVRSAEYLLAHSALRHYVLAAGSSALGNIVGAVGLAEQPDIPAPSFLSKIPGGAPQTENPETKPGSAIAQLCSAVREVTGQPLAEAEIAVQVFEIRGGSCVVVRLPPPQSSPEAYMVGIATPLRLCDLGDSDLSKLEGRPQYFTLEKTRTPTPRVHPAMLCQWKSLSREDYYERRRRNYGWGPNPVEADFVDCIERIMVSGIWRSTEY